MLRMHRRQVCQANIELHKLGLAPITFGNVSAICRERGVVIIKPSGVHYHDLCMGNLAMVDLDGRPLEGSPAPSTDLKTHLALYRAFPDVGAVAHTHSVHATMFAQACKPIPCLGTTHADYFRGEVPVTRPLTADETGGDYETATGDVIVERFKELNPIETPGALVANHGAFTWGANPAAAVEISLVLETVARMALGTMLINPDAGPAPQHLVDKHYQRKHGPGAYYGQKQSDEGEE